MSKSIDRVKVGAIHYEVAYVDGLRDERDDKPLDGCVRHAQTKISLEASLSHQATMQTLLHEVVHAMLAQLGGPFLKDTVIDALAYSLYQVIRENPELVRQIQEKP